MNEEVLVLQDNEFGRLLKTIVGEFDFPEFIVEVKGPYSGDKRFSYDDYKGAEAYYNDLAFELACNIN